MDKKVQGLNIKAIDMYKAFEIQKSTKNIA